MDCVNANLGFHHFQFLLLQELTKNHQSLQKWQRQFNELDVTRIESQILT